jgi:hypothetical protein
MRTTLTTVEKLKNNVVVVELNNGYMAIHNDSIMKDDNVTYGCPMPKLFKSKKEAFEAAREAVNKYPICAGSQLTQQQNCSITPVQ